MSCKYHSEEISCFVKRSCVLTNFFTSNSRGILKLPDSVFYLGSPHTLAGLMQGAHEVPTLQTLTGSPLFPKLRQQSMVALGPPYRKGDLTSPSHLEN